MFIKKVVRKPLDFYVYSIYAIAVELWSCGAVGKRYPAFKIAPTCVSFEGVCVLIYTNYLQI